MPEQNINDVKRTAQSLVDNGLTAAAETVINSNGFKGILVIDEGRVYDVKDACAIALEKFVTLDADMLALKEDVAKLANEDFPVLITGPTGTGKELIAQALHGRRTGKFRAINCAGLPDTLVESELFGYKQGSFTGAMRDTDGLMQRANDGTLFLDEINSLPLSAQGKLLRAIQTKKIRKVGGKDDETINCRFVCATNVSLVDMCNTGTFRIDLYARVSTFELHTKGLDRRKDDIISIYKALGATEKLITHIETLLKETPNLIEIAKMYPFNVRSIEQHIVRHRVLGHLP